MGKHYVVLSFFKSNKIDYYFDSALMTIIFPCPYCGEQANMDAITSTWSCTICEKSGNLLTLLNTNKEAPITTTVYNPKRERIKINRMFNDLLNIQQSSKYEQGLLTLKDKVNDLIDYYKNTK